MHTSNNTQPRPTDETNTLVAELLVDRRVFKEATKHTTKANPFLHYYQRSNGVEMDFPSLRAAADETQPLYIVAADNPVQSFSLIARKAIPNTLGKLPKDDLRRALGSLLDNA